MEHSGYWIWEASAFLLQIAVAMGLLVPRRKASGKPAVADEDQRLFVDPFQVTVSPFRFWIHFGGAALLCYLAAFLGQLIFTRFGGSILATAQLLTLLEIIKRLFC